jgi:EAL domain-containing protein (putative c-di-GMP-specific phosphodiesterase class I)
MNGQPAKRQTGCGACRDGADIFPLSMAFQPVVDVQTRRIVAHEALVRGPGGESAAQVFAQVTDENRYAFDQTCRTKAIDLASRLGMDCTLNINFMPNAVYQPDTCIQTTFQAAKRTGFPLERITFEIVEQEDLADFNHLKRIVTAYQAYGFKIALDDFGTGYSGLSRLAELKPDIIKLDRALITDCHKDSTRNAIIASMVKLAQKLHIKLVAEGVETAEELHALETLRVRFIQGFYFSKPVFEGLASASEISWPGAPAAREVAQAPAS